MNPVPLVLVSVIAEPSVTGAPTSRVVPAEILVPASVRLPPVRWIAPALVTGACSAAVPEAVTLILAGAVAAPTAPLNWTPPALTVSTLAPFTVPPNVTCAGVVTVVAAASVTGPVVLHVAAPVKVYAPPSVTALPRRSCPLAVLTLPTLSVPGRSVTKLDSGTVPPTAPVKLVAPAVLTISACAPDVVPFTVLLNIIGLAPVSARAMPPVKVSAPIQVWPSAVVRFRPRLVGPVELSVKPPRLDAASAPMLLAVWLRL